MSITSCQAAGPLAAFPAGAALGVASAVAFGAVPFLGAARVVPTIPDRPE